MQKSPLRSGLSGQYPHPGLYRSLAPGRAAASGRHHRRRQFVAFDLRPRLPAGIAVRRLLHSGHQERTGRHRQTRTFRRRLETRTRRRGVPHRTAQRPQSRRDRQRPGRTGLRQRPCENGLRSQDIRSPAQGGRRTGLRHSRIPSAQTAHRGARDRRSRAARRGDRNRCHRGPHRHRRFAARRGGVRRRIHRLRRGTSPLHGHSGREPQRRGFGQRIP